MNQINSVKCPICSQEKTWRPSNHFKPFCSERCKLIDLGEWASETRRIISSEPVSPDDDAELWD
jgi:endogenous inhibitor of DNA gyrase (YacG/DUF329 family)